jgi:glycyl-tRNA synthetase beta chain
MKELLFEIGTEEIPANLLKSALKQIPKILEKLLTLYKISHTPIHSFGTPRRLVAITSLNERQEDIQKQIIGPPLQLAFNKDKTPKRPALEFLKRHQAELKDLQIIKTKKGEYIGINISSKGKPTLSLLPQILKELISSIQFQKSMRWANFKERFARPIHWLLALFGKDIIPLEYAGIKSDAFSFGHRFLSPNPIKIKDASQYFEKMQNAHVVPNHTKRLAMLQDQLKKSASSLKGTWLEDPELLEEVNFLIEEPFVIIGKFDPKFLSLPKEVIIAVMRNHQRYFALLNENKELQNAFMAVLNGKPEDINPVRLGNERVLHARLKDAQFFFEDDLKIPLKKRTKMLSGMLFQTRLGTMEQKTHRIIKLATALSKILKPEILPKVKLAALLSKADLTTQMVAEFPELQGIMGREYAKRTNEDHEIAEAIYESYLPRTASDQVPKGDIGAIIGIADRIDTILGCFSQGLKPSGEQDPYGLRRNTLGIIRIIIKKKYHLSLKKLLEISQECFNQDKIKINEVILDQVTEFFKARLQAYLKEHHPKDIVEAVMATSFDDILDTTSKVEVLSRLKDQKEFKDFFVAFKRTFNISKNFFEITEINKDLFEYKEEYNLFNALKDIKEDIISALREKRYRDSLLLGASLRGYIDQFFDRVYVMVEDKRRRLNRLSLLAEISGLFSDIANFNLIHINN